MAKSLYWLVEVQPFAGTLYQGDLHMLLEEAEKEYTRFSLDAHAQRVYLYRCTVSADAEETTKILVTVHRRFD